MPRHKHIGVTQKRLSATEVTENTEKLLQKFVRLEAP
jgi:hypothetical protein